MPHEAMRALVLVALLFAACVPMPDALEPREAEGPPVVIAAPTEPPATEPPATEPPVMEPPVMEPPAMEPPVMEPPVMEPPTNPDPNALRFEIDIKPILAMHCMECHDSGRTLDFGRLPLGPGGVVGTTDLILAAAQANMPPAPREAMPADALDKIRTWKMQGYLP